MTSKGYTHTEEARQRISAATKKRWATKKYRDIYTQVKVGSLNPQWKGDKVGLASLHEWVTSRLPKPKKCQDCKVKPPLDLANKTNKYLRDLDDWEWLCRSCHMIKDGRLAKLQENAKKYHTTRLD